MIHPTILKPYHGMAWQSESCVCMYVCEYECMCVYVFNTRQRKLKP
jgi:hypothetical protein